MPDLLSSARMLEISSKFEGVASALLDLPKDQKPESAVSKRLHWVGNFLFEIDWDCNETREQKGISSGGVEATHTRPAFYSALTRMPVKEFADAAVTTEQELTSFLSEFYEFLLSGGEKPQLSPERIDLASKILSSTSRVILAELSNNGVPPEREGMQTLAMK